MSAFAGNRRITLYLFLFLFGIYFLTATGNNINGTDQQLARFEQTRSIVEKGELAIPDGLGVKGNNNKDYSWYGIGQPVLAIPCYVIGASIGGYSGAQALVSLLNQFVVAVSGIILFLFIRELGYVRKTAVTVTLFYALGTLAWPQAKHPFDHPVEMLFVLSAVYYAYRYRKDDRTWYLLISSASLGYAFITRMPAVLAFAPIVGFLFMSRNIGDGGEKGVKTPFREFVVYSSVFAPFVLVQLWYNYARFGSIFETGATLLARKSGLDLFAGTDLFTGLRGFLTSPGKGFFFYSPVAVLFFFSLKDFYKKQKGLTLCILGIIVSYLLFLSKYSFWHGDWAWGPRYLLIITPLLMIPVADFVENKFYGDGKILKWAVLGLFFVSVGVQLIGVSVDFQRYFISLQREKGVRFTLVGGNEVPFTFEPPMKIYFEWDKSPIAYQASFAWKHMDSLGAPFHMDAQNDQRMRGKHADFDFWWHYNTFAGVAFSSMLLILILLAFIIAASGFKLMIMVRE